jgi:tetratricopeptide (TPR) repeat protein
MHGDLIARFRDDIAHTAHELYTHLAGLAYSSRRVDEAAGFLKKAIDELELSNSGGVQLAWSYNRLGVMNAYAGRFTEAERLIRRAMSLFEQFPQEVDDVATCTCSLARVHYLMGDAKQALALASRGLELSVLACGEQSLEVAWALDLLGELHAELGDPTLALNELRRAGAIKRKLTGPEDWEVGITSAKQAELLVVQGRYNEAEPLLWEAVTIGENALGRGTPGLGRLYARLANLYAKQRKYSEAEGLLRYALAVQVHAYEPGHPDILTNLRKLAEMAHAQGKITQGEALWNLAQSILAGAQNQGKVLTFEFRRELRRVSEVGLARSAGFTARA